MFVLKGCPRCGGDLQSGIDDDLTCIQCGKDLSANEREQLQRRVRVSREPVTAS